MLIDFSIFHAYSDPNSGESCSSIDTITTDDDESEGTMPNDDSREGTMTSDDSREETMTTDDDSREETMSTDVNPRVKILICQWNQILV